MLCFVIVGALTGLAASILIGWVHGVSRGYGPGYELDVIAAVVIGGTNLFGGIGSVFGTFLGAAITGMITTGLVLLGAQQDSEPIAKGAVIILAVLLDVDRAPPARAVGADAVTARARRWDWAAIGSSGSRAPHPH